MITNRRPAYHQHIGFKLIITLLAFFAIGTLPASAENQIVTVGVYENAPKIFTSESGQPAGIFIDIIENIAKDEGWNLHYVSGTWGEGLDRLARGKIDLMPDVAYTVTREKVYAFHKLPVLSSWFQVYAPKGNRIKSILDLNEKRILVLERSVQHEAFEQLSKGFGLNCSLVTTPDYKTMFEMVAKGEADAAVTNRFYGVMHAKKFGLVDTAILFEPSDLFYAAPKGDPKHLLGTIDRHLTDLKSNQQSVYYASMKRCTLEQVPLQLPLWLQIVGFGGISLLAMSLCVSALLRHQVNKRTQELLQENQERQTAQQLLADIIDFLPDATFVIDQKKQVIAWNKACESMTGVRKEEMLGQDNYAYAEPFFGKRRPILIDLLDQPSAEVAATYTTIQRKDCKLFAEFFVPSLRNGQGAYLWGVATPLYNKAGLQCGAIETIRDISEQKLMEDALRKSERDYRELVMLANSIIMRWSPDGEITFLNEFGQRFFGYTAIEIIGRNVIGTIVPAKEIMGRDLRSLIEDIGVAPQSFERNINENIRRDGERVWVDWTNKAVLNEQGEIKEILSIGSDITVRKHAEELQKAMEAAQAADHIKSAFLATMSHELRTPLNSIIGFTGIMLQGLTGPLNPEQLKQMTMVQKSSRHLLSLINDVLDISKIEAGQLVLACTAFDLRSSIIKMVELVTPLSDKKGIELLIDLPATPATITTDQRRLEQVILNLLNNGIKFTDNGHVGLSCRIESQQVLLVFSDTGIGMQQEELQNIFQPFRQIDTGLARKREGTGLGLSICKKIIDMMGGSIKVQSDWGQGSTFTVLLPSQAEKTV